MAAGTVSKTVPPPQYGVDETSRVHHGGRVLSVRRECTRPVPAPDWTATDAAGHLHASGSDSDPFPSLIRVSDGFAEPSETPWDIGEIEQYHLACRQCAETIWPAAGGPGFAILPSVYTYWIDGEPATEREAREFLEQIRQADPERYDWLRYWIRYSAGLVPARKRISPV